MRDSKVRSSRECGFTLVEALVALVVLSIGLLGIAGLQITSLKSNHGSATRTQAVYLAYDVIDRMRANPTAAINHDYEIAIGATPAGGTIAGDDLVAWKQNIKNALPSGFVAPDGSVAFDATANTFTVSIVWDDAHADTASRTDISTAARPADIVTFSVTTQLSN
jgi:type IV pilus assembly protein PilV